MTSNDELLLYPKQSIDYDTINPGIRGTVARLRFHGFHTCDSGDGRTHDHECDLPMPYVHMRVHPDRLVAESKRLLILIGGTPGVLLLTADGTSAIQATYCPDDDIATLSIFGFDDASLGNAIYPLPRASLATDRAGDGEGT